MNYEFISDACEIVVVTCWNTRDRILFNPFEHCNAYRPSHVLKYLDRVVRRAAIAIKLRITISKLILSLNAKLVHVIFGSKCVYSSSCLVVAFECVRIDHACCFENANSSTAFAAETTASILHCHQLFREAALLEVEI